jgi:phosphoserine phosphatase
MIHQHTFFFSLTTLQMTYTPPVYYIRAQIEACLAAHPFELSPGLEGLVKALMGRGTDVYLVSGGEWVMLWRCS